MLSIVKFFIFFLNPIFVCVYRREIISVFDKSQMKMSHKINRSFLHWSNERRSLFSPLILLCHYILLNNNDGICYFSCFVQRHLANANVIINTVHLSNKKKKQKTNDEPNWSRVTEITQFSALCLLRCCCSTLRKNSSSINMHYGYRENHMLINHRI